MSHQDRPAAATRSVRRGEWDVCEGFLGIPGSGKSTACAARVVELQREHAPYVLVHDAEHTFPRKLPNGVRLDVMDHGSIASCERALKDPHAALRVHAIAVEDAAPVVQLAMRVGETSVARRGRPALAVIEEVTNYDEMASGGKLGPTVKRALTLRRHLHCGIFYTTQSPMLVHQHVLSKSTRLYVFRLESEADVSHVVRFGGFPRDSAAEIQNLKRFHFLLKKPKGFDDGR